MSKTGIIHICFMETHFHCPYCAKEYDIEALPDWSKRKQGYGTKTCTCGERFGYTVDITGDAVGFKLKGEMT